MTYEDQQAGGHVAAMATGWLISPNTLVTAGHVVYDHSGNDGKGYGKVQTMQCYIGYNGRDSLESGLEFGFVQSRSASKVVTPGEWVDKSDYHHRDVAFIQVDQPFTGNPQLFSIIPTPMSGNERIGVVGYPQDMSITSDDGSNEPGAQMYEDFELTTYDRRPEALNMLRYTISTYAGQSDAPVVRGLSQVSIGAHCYGAIDKNYASTIGGENCNDYAAYISVFSASLPTVNSVDGIMFVQPAFSSTS